jgi:hypothetical protein
MRNHSEGRGVRTDSLDSVADDLSVGCQHSARPAVCASQDRIPMAPAARLDLAAGAVKAWGLARLGLPSHQRFVEAGEGARAARGGGTPSCP